MSEGTEVPNLTKKTKYHEEVKKYMRKKGAQENLARDLVARDRIAQRTREKALRDHLTGLPNRLYLENLLKRDFAYAQRTGNPLSVGILDLDHFKEVNDSFGHDAGDEVLREAAGIIKDKLGRGSDFVTRARTSLKESSASGERAAARAGGEEFVIVLPLTDKQGAQKIGEDIKQAFESDEGIREILGRPQKVSIGIATMNDSEEFKSQQDFLKAADTALYNAKERGRNQVVMWEEGMQHPAFSSQNFNPPA